jgi:hypothetical protein
MVGPLVMQEIENIGRAYAEHAWELGAQYARLATTHVTKAEMITGKVEAGIDFPKYRTALAVAEALLKKHPDASFNRLAGQSWKLNDAVRLFRDAFKQVEAFEKR